MALLSFHALKKEKKKKKEIPPLECFLWPFYALLWPSGAEAFNLIQRNECAP